MSSNNGIITEKNTRNSKFKNFIFIFMLFNYSYLNFLPTPPEFKIFLTLNISLSYYNFSV